MDDLVSYGTPSAGPGGLPTIHVVSDSVGLTAQAVWELVAETLPPASP